MWAQVPTAACVHVTWSHLHGLARGASPCAGDWARCWVMLTVCDFQQHLSELMTRKWLLGSNAVDIICVTVEDYFNDFAKIKKPYKKVRVEPLGAMCLPACGSPHVISCRVQCWVSSSVGGGSQVVLLTQDGGGTDGSSE